MTKKKILEGWHRGGKGDRYGYVAVCLRGCPYSEGASVLFPRVKRKIIWLNRDSLYFEKAKRMFRQKTFPICLAVPKDDMKWTLAQFFSGRRPGIIRLGGFSDISA